MQQAWNEERREQAEADPGISTHFDNKAKLLIPSNHNVELAQI
jgi:hypothetical protein